MRTRLAIGAAALLVGMATVFAGVWEKLPGKWSDFAVNLGSELVGIVVTIVVIDWILERRRRQDEARRIALQALHELDHAVWIWQGGAREFDIAELLGLLGNVSDADPLPRFTQNLLLVAGSKAANTLRIRAEEVASDSHLRSGLEELARIEAMRDGTAPMSSRLVAKHARGASELFAKAAGIAIPTTMVLPPERFRDNSIAEQEWRHYGRPRQDVQVA